MSGNLTHEQMLAFTDCIDAGEAAATGNGMSAVVTLGMMLDRDPVVALQVLASILAGLLKSHAAIKGWTVPEVAMDLRAKGAA